MSGGTAILTAGPFGAAVAHAIGQIDNGARAAPLAPRAPSLPDKLAGADFVILVTWRGYPAAAEALDRQFHASGTAWTEVTLDGPLLRAGPCVMPGVSPCHGCFRTRWLSNSPIADRELALDACFARDPAIGLHGFTPAQVQIAAALALAQRRDGKGAAGRVQIHDIRSGGLTEERVIRVHGCARCGPGAPAGDRYWRHVQGIVRRAGGR